jgi:hypothetical protein
MFPSLITFAHFFISRLRWVRNSTGALATISSANTVSGSPNSRVFAALMISLYQVGLVLGRKTPWFHDMRRG